MATHSQCYTHCAVGNWGSFVVSCACAGGQTSAGLITRNVLVSLWPDSSRNTQSTTRANFCNETCAYCSGQMVSCPSDAKGRRILGRICDMALRRNVERRIHQTVQGRLSEQYAVETPLQGRPTYWERPFTRFLGDAWIPKLKLGTRELSGSH